MFDVSEYRHRLIPCRADLYSGNAAAGFFRTLPDGNGLRGNGVPRPADVRQAGRACETQLSGSHAVLGGRKARRTLPGVKPPMKEGTGCTGGFFECRSCAGVLLSGEPYAVLG